MFLRFAVVVQIPFLNHSPTADPGRRDKKTGVFLSKTPAIEQCDALLRNSTLLDTSLLTSEVTQVVDTCTTYNTILVYLDLVDVW